MAGSHPLDELKSQELLALYGGILDELVRREVIRSRNAPAGDLAERLVQDAYDGELAPPSEKSWDVRTPEGLLLQVKCRVVGDSSRPGQYSFFRSWDFDTCVFVTFTREYQLVKATEVPAASIQAIASFSDHVKGSRVTISKISALPPGSIDVTDRIAEAYERLP
ncbi:hypothetical protein [Myceligenerans crystallogenes]|uniref:Restriction endonuclease n=1 Tax=Myceligenerans crystallogenes TaxID=316335 RepID=A0ABN2NKN3_9MICO